MRTQKNLHLLKGYYYISTSQGVPDDSVVKKPPASAGNSGSIDPWRKKWQPTPVFLLGKSHGQRSLAEHSPWGHKESDTTESLSKHALYFRTSQVAVVVKNPPASAGDFKRHRFYSWVGKIRWRRAWLPIPVFLPGGSHGQRRLVDYSPWGRRESDTTEVT